MDLLQRNQQNTYHARCQFSVTSSYWCYAVSKPQKHQQWWVLVTMERPGKPQLVMAALTTGYWGLGTAAMAPRPPR